MANQEILYYNVCENFSVYELANGIKHIMEQAQCETQIITLSDTSYVVQCRNTSNDGWWRKLTGNAKALTVALDLNNLRLAVQIGNTEWGDKAAGYVLAYLVFWPLAITATYGIYSQNQLKQQVLDYIRNTTGHIPTYN